jgi:hypothetical protein
LIDHQSDISIQTYQRTSFGSKGIEKSKHQYAEPSTVDASFSTNKFFLKNETIKLGSLTQPKCPVPAFLPI